MKTLWRIIAGFAVLALGLLAVFTRGKKAGKAEQAAQEATDKAKAVREEVKAMPDAEVVEKAKKWVRRG